jgi:hypothetical protein
MRLHATAHIQQQKDVDGHVFAREIVDRHNASVNPQDEIALLKAGHRAPALI